MASSVPAGRTLSRTGTTAIIDGQRTVPHVVAGNRPLTAILTAPRTLGVFS
jgi:hypothetical protein